MAGGGVLLAVGAEPDGAVLMDWLIILLFVPGVATVLQGQTDVIRAMPDSATVAARAYAAARADEVAEHVPLQAAAGDDLASFRRRR